MENEDLNFNYRFWRPKYWPIVLFPYENLGRMHGDRTVNFRITTWCVSATPHPTLKMVESERFELSLIGSEPIELTIILTLNHKLSKIIIIKNPNTTFVRFGLTISWKWNYKSVSNLNSMKEAKQTMLLKPNCIIHIHKTI